MSVKMIPNMGVTGMDAVNKKAKPRNKLQAGKVFTRSGKEAVTGLRAKSVIPASRGRRKDAITGIK